MGKAFVAPVAVCTLLVAALSGCAATGEPYPESLARAGSLTEGTGRVVLLRSDDLANRNYMSPAYVRIKEDLVGKLAYGGFLIAEVPAGDVVLQASRRAARTASASCTWWSRREKRGTWMSTRDPSTWRPTSWARSSAAPYWRPPRIPSASGISRKP